MLWCSAVSALSWEWASSRGEFWIAKVDRLVADTDGLIKVWVGACRNGGRWCHKVAVGDPVPNSEICVRSRLHQVRRFGRWLAGLPDYHSVIY